MSIRASLISLVMRQTIKKQFDAVGESQESVDAFRETLAKSSQLSGKLPDGILLREETINDVNCEWVSMPGVDETKVILYFHGGGYVFGDPKTYRDFAWRLSEASNCPVLLVDYGLAPENAFPTAVDDATKCYSWLLENGYKADQIAFGGDSAGGGLTVAALVNAKNLGFPQPKCAILLSPWLDLTASGDSVDFNAKSDVMLTRRALDTMAKHYIGDRDRNAPLASPLFADLNQLPPILMHVGSGEILLSDAERFKTAYNEAGGDIELKIWPKMPHVFQIFAARIPEGKTAIVQFADFVRGHLESDQVDT